MRRSRFSVNRTVLSSVPGIAIAAAAAGCAPADALDAHGASPTGASSWVAPTLIAPLPGQRAGAPLRVRTRATECLAATGCCLDVKALAVASGGAGDFDAPVPVLTAGAHRVSCSGRDGSGTHAFDLGSVLPGRHAFDLGTSWLSSGAAYQVAVGRPMIRDHASSWVADTAP